MKTTGLLLLLLVALGAGEQMFGCPQGPPTAPLPPGALDDVFARVDAMVARSYRHNIALGVVYDQQLVHFTGSPGVTADSAFRIGSNSKVLTALLVWLSHQSGKLHLDDPVADTFPVFGQFKNRWTEGTRSITWRDLISHRAGLARESPCQALWGECNRTLEQVAAIVKDWPAIGPLASRPSYSNLGFALTGHLVAQLHGVPYIDLLRAAVLGPLNMTRTDFPAAGAAPPSYLVPGFEQDQPVPNYDFGFENPAGGAYSTVRDLAQLLQMLFRDEVAAGGGQPLDGTLIREWLAPVWLGAGPEPIAAYGAPWEMYLTPWAPDTWIRGKLGAVLGYTSQLAAIPELKLAVVCLLGDGLAGDAQRPALDALQLLGPPLSALLAKLQPAPPVPAPALLGVYDGAEDGFARPPFLGPINATLSRAADPRTGAPRLVLTMLAQVGSIVTTAAQGFLDLSAPDSTPQTEYYRLVSQSPQSCDAQTGGGSQFLTRNTSDGTLRLSGLYYGFVFTKRSQ